MVRHDQAHELRRHVEIEHNFQRATDPDYSQVAAGMIALSQSLSSSHAHGLFEGAPASDNELFAGYCIAVEESSAAWIASGQAQEDQTPVPGVPPTDWQPASSFTQQQRERYAAYLAARGLRPPVDRLDAFLGIRNAQARGQADAK